MVANVKKGSAILCKLSFWSSRRRLASAAKLLGRGGFIFGQRAEIQGSRRAECSRPLGQLVVLFGSRHKCEGIDGAKMKILSYLRIEDHLRMERRPVSRDLSKQLVYHPEDHLFMVEASAGIQHLKVPLFPFPSPSR